MKAYRIREWRQRYEVSAKGRIAKGEGKLQAGPFKYVRMKVNGHKKGGGQLRLEQVAGTKARYEACMAVFPQLLALAADEPRDMRGWILDEHGTPATAEAIGFFVGFRVRSIEIALEILSDNRIRWIVQEDYPETPGTTRKRPETSGIAPLKEELKEEEEGKEKTGSPPFDEILAAYNRTCPPAGLAAVNKLTDGRRAKLKARWKEQAFRDGYERIFAKAAASKFLRGKVEGKKWKATLGWLIKNEDNYTRVLEGEFDDDGQGANPAEPEQRPEVKQWFKDHPDA